MEKRRLNFRVEQERIKKLKRIAEYRKKTMTQLVEDWIDSLEVPESK